MKAQGLFSLFYVCFLLTLPDNNQRFRFKEGIYRVEAVILSYAAHFFILVDEDLELI